MSLIHLFIGFFLNYFLIKKFIFIADKYKIVAASEARSSHKGTVVSGAGFVFIFVFIFLFYSQSFSLNFVLPFASVSAIFFTSFLDDIIDIKFYYKLFCQVLFLFLLFFSLGFDLIFCITLLLIFFVNINVSNFMDGVNGMSFLYFLVSFVSFIFIDFKINVILLDNVYFFYIILLSCLLSFGFLNFRKKAICFLGDVGSISLGLIFSGCVVYYFLLLKAQVLINYPYLVILFFFIYYLDVFYTLLNRFSSNQNIFKPHKKHLYQILANNYFKSHITSSFLYSFFQLIMNVMVLVILFSKNFFLSKLMLVVLCFYICLIIFIYFYVQKKIVKENS